jgi:hypothetical protein
MSGDYWASTKSPVHLFRASYESPELARHITENAFVDPAILAAELGIPHFCTAAIKSYQRRLGVRRLACNR